MMEQDEFIEEVQQNVLRNHAIHISREEAFEAIRATLETLGEYLVNLTTLSSYLPPAFAPFLHQPTSTADLTLEEFIAQVAERESVDAVPASYHVRGVFAALSEALPPAVATDVCAQLPEQLAQLLGCHEGPEAPGT